MFPQLFIYGEAESRIRVKLPFLKKLHLLPVSPSKAVRYISSWQRVRSPKDTFMPWVEIRCSVEHDKDLFNVPAKGKLSGEVPETGQNSVLEVFGHRTSIGQAAENPAVPH